MSNIFSKFYREASPPAIGVAKGGERGLGPPKILENIVILCFERRFSRQNSVIRLKSNILPPKIFGLATPLRPAPPLVTGLPTR